MKTKNIISIFIALCFCNCCLASAEKIEAVYSEEDFLLERIEQWHEPFIAAESYIFDIDGKNYFFSEMTWNEPREYIEAEYEFFARNNGIRDYFWTGEYYFARRTWTDYESESYKGNNHKIFLYDENFNLIKEYTFSQYPLEITYIDGTYYVRLAPYLYYGSNIQGKVVCSQDFETWEDVDDIVYKRENIYHRGNDVSFNGKDYYNLLFENKDAKWFNLSDVGFSRVEFPLWQLINTKYITKDGIYFLELDRGNIPKNLGYVIGTYFYEDKYIIQYSKDRKVIMDKNDIITKLDSIKNAPYVKYDNTILGFEQPPVIENDRTLIPIRFLFEQMGATVDWNADTQTATISQNNTSISFAINDTEANVNGQTVSMDVPARLINDKTMVPVRFLSEELGYTVDWDGENRIIIIE